MFAADAMVLLAIPCLFAACECLWLLLTVVPSAAAGALPINRRMSSPLLDMHGHLQVTPSPLTHDRINPLPHAGCTLTPQPYLVAAISMTPDCARDCTSCACKFPASNLLDANTETFTETVPAAAPAMQFPLDVAAAIGVTGALVVGMQVGVQCSLSLQAAASPRWGGAGSGRGAWFPERKQKHRAQSAL